MDRSSPISALFAVGFGAVFGFLALFLREMGWVLAAVGMTFLSAVYVRQRRLPDIGWLLLAAGVTPALILARNGLNAVLDPAVDVGIDTWLLLVAAISIAVVGGLVLYATWGRGKANA